MLEMMTRERTLDQLEAVIERGQQTFIEVGEALSEIQERRLYRQYGYDTFEDYCKDRWGWTRDMGYKYIAAAHVVQNVESIIQSPPSLTQAIQLAPLSAEQQREIAERVDFASTTVRELRSIVNDSKGIRKCPACGHLYDGGKFPNYCPYCELSPTARIEGLRTSMAVHYSSESAEWYTPPEIIERTIRLFGRIDLDPCSNDRNSPNVPAAYCYTREDDGLAQEWTGRVYMNPPYGRIIGDWTSKLLAECRAGRVSEAIALVPARVDTDWWRQLRDCAVCFIDGRLKFSGMDNSAPFPSAVVYFGKRTAAFHAAFGDMGDVWVRWND